jgi:hypothetical protein
MDSLVNIYIKQYGYTKKFLNDYYKEDEATGTLTCGVTGRTLLYPNEKSLSEFMLDDMSSFSVQTLGPLFNHKVDIFESKCELEIEFNADRILDHSIRVKDAASDLQELMILCKRNEKVSLLVYHIKMRSWLNTHMSFL